jgi:tetratricopeptide (TPR) repeat protein
MSKLMLVVYLQLVALTAAAQLNCDAWPHPATKKACHFYNEAARLEQGSYASQALLDSAIAADPSFAPAWREKSVPYLKRGDFAGWKPLIDKAAALDPEEYLPVRAWCLFKFLRDYEGALADFRLLDSMSITHPGTSGDGEYNLLILRGLCERELGRPLQALAILDSCISLEESNGYIGLYDYLHRGVTQLALQNYKAAMKDFEKQVTKYESLADTYYYMALAHRGLKQPAAAKECLVKARELYTAQGFHRNNPYCAAPDQVYLADIDRELTVE